MKKSKIIFIIIFLAAAAAVLYFSYGVIRNRYFAPGKNNGAMQNQAAGGASGQSIDQSGNSQENSSSDNGTVAPQNGQPNIANADCDNNCAQFKGNPDNLTYCQEVCGLRPISPKDSEGQCENLTGLNKDACWRDLAVSKKDISICDKISDSKLQKVCRNRVTEEILN